MFPNDEKPPLPDFQRIARLFARILILSALFLVPLFFCTQVKRNFAFPKYMAFRFLVLTALFVWLGVRYRWRDWASPGRAPWIVFLFGAVASLAMAPNLTESFDVGHVPDLVGMFILFQILYSLARSPRFLHLTTLMVGVQIGLASFYGLTQDLGIDKALFEGSLYFPTGKNEAVSTMGNINFAGEYQVAAFPIALALLLSARNLHTRIFFAVVAILADWNFVAQDTDGSNLGFFLGMLVVVPLGMWVWPRKGKLLVFFTATGFAVEGVFTVFRFWWNNYRAYWVAVRTSDAISVRYANKLRDLNDYVERAMNGAAQFREKLPELSKDIKVAILIALLGVAWFYGIPALARRLAGPGQTAEDWARQFKRKFVTSVVVVGIALVVIGGPIYVSISIAGTNEYLREGGTVPYHHYFEVQPDAEHPYTLRHFFLHNVLSQWTYVFRWECWQAASANLVDNGVILGIGRGNFKVIHPLYASQLERKLLGAEVLARKVHNEWLATGLECGFFGIFGQIWLFGVFYYCAWLVVRRLRRRFQANPGDESGLFVYFITLGFLCSLIGTCFHNSVSSNLFQPSSSVLTYWVGACLCAMAYPRRSEKAHHG